MSIHAIDLHPFTAPPLSLNKRTHWAAEDRIKKDLRWLIRARCHDIGKHDHIDVWLRWQPKVKRNRDGDNPIATVKPCVDELVRCGIVPDDTTEHVTHKPLELLDADRYGGKLWLCVETR